MGTPTAPPPAVADPLETVLREINAAIDELTFGAREPLGDAAPAMPAFARILACHDGTQRSGKVVDWARHVALQHHARVTVASVAPTPNAAFYTPLLGGYYYDLTEDYARAEASLRKAAEGAAAILRERGVDAESVCTTGAPARELANIARTHRSDLVVLGAHGGGAVTRMLLGSVAASLAGSVDASILVARGNPPASRVLVAADGSAASRRAVAAALRYASALGAELVVQHVLDVSEDVPLPSEAQLNLVVQKLRLARPPRIRYALDAGAPARRIVERAAREGCDLIVMGARGLGRVRGALMGSVSHRVVNTAGVSVLVVREP